jgi:hypothetical protein
MFARLPDHPIHELLPWHWHAQDIRTSPLKRLIRVYSRPRHPRFRNAVACGHPLAQSGNRLDCGAYRADLRVREDRRLESVFEQGDSAPET